MNINYRDITIIIPTHAQLKYLTYAVERIRSIKKYDDCQILIGADTAPDEVKTWLEENNTKLKYDFVTLDGTPETVHPLDKRVGIIRMVEALVERVKTPYLLYLHDDMVIGEHTIDEFIKNYSEKHILSGFRVEPPIYGASQNRDKEEVDLGVDPETFNVDGFKEIEEQFMKSPKGENERGFFAPHFFATKDFVGYDHLFLPSNREDSDIALRFEDAGKTLLMVKTAVVYHFSGKGTRNREDKKHEGVFNWQHTKNSLNFIRKYKCIAHNPCSAPVRVPDVDVGLLALVGKKDTGRLLEFISMVEPFFDEIVFVCDDTEKECREAVESYAKTQDEFKPHNFDVNKFVFVSHDLNNDFATQTNIGLEKINAKWILRLDLDERVDQMFLNNIRILIDAHVEQNPNLSVIGFPRMNYLDNKISNDIPPQEWFSEKFDTYPDKPEGINNLDPQFRLTKKGVKYARNVHEAPEPVVNQDYDAVVIEKQLIIHHPKTREEQMKQLEHYAKILNPQVTEINKIVYDSVIYTYEGITEHARKEAIELQKLGYQILLLDNRYREGFEPELSTMYNPIDFTKNDYVTIVNQPPPRWEASKHYKNRIGYLAFEGKLPKEWVETINTSNVVEVWTPSEYCKDMFEKSGVNKNIEVIPHGLNDSFYPEDNKKNDTFTFFAMGTYHNNRKGLDLVAKAFSEEFKDDEDVQLIFKVNNIYNPNLNFNNYLNRYIDFGGNTNITYVNENLTEDELRDMFNSAHVYVSPHRSEGFGINILNAIGCGLPVVCTGKTGNIDFTSEFDSVLHIESNGLKWSRFQPPYDRAKWEDPNLEDLKQKMRQAYKEYSSLSERAKQNSKVAHDKYSWKRVGETIDERIKELST